VPHIIKVYVEIVILNKMFMLFRKSTPPAILYQIRNVKPPWIEVSKGWY